jgi:hypothetical protein
MVAIKWKHLGAIHLIIINNMTILYCHFLSDEDLKQHFGPKWEKINKISYSLQLVIQKNVVESFIKLWFWNVVANYYYCYFNSHVAMPMAWKKNS